MKTKFASVVAIATLGYSAVVYAELPISVDARTLDISGIKAGMGFDETKAALAKHFSTSPLSIKVDPYPQSNPITETKLPSYLSYEKGNERLIVHFEPRIPVDPSNPQVVSQITYEIPWTQENEKAMADAAIRKYGPPSNGTNGVTLQWCESPSPNLGMGCSVNNPAVLTVSSTKVQFVDRERIDARVAAMRKAESVSPGF